MNLVYEAQWLSKLRKCKQSCLLHNQTEINYHKLNYNDFSYKFTLELTVTLTKRGFFGCLKHLATYIIEQKYCQ